MSHAIQLPDDLYQKLASVAARQSETPEQVLATWVRLFVSGDSTTAGGHFTERGTLATDPLAPFIGAFTSGSEAGWIERHDEAFGN